MSANPDIVADLHTHTTVTDGRVPPEELIGRAARAGLSYLVITDHSAVVFEGLAPVARRHGIRLPFPGVEISTQLEGRRHHLVAYGPGVLDEGFRNAVQPVLAAKNRAAKHLRDRLVQAGHALPELDVILAYGDGPGGAPTPERRLVSRTSIARHLAAVAGLTQEAAYRLIRDVEPLEQTVAERYLPTLEVLDRAAALGITVSLAHPLWRCRDDGDVTAVCDDVALLAEHGLSALETRSYHHRPFDDHPLLLAARCDLGLLSSGGSDYHANGKTELGRDGVGAEAFEALATRVHLLAARTVTHAY